MISNMVLVIDPANTNIKKAALVANSGTNRKI